MPKAIWDVDKPRPLQEHVFTYRLPEGIHPKLVVHVVVGCDERPYVSWSASLRDDKVCDLLEGIIRKVREEPDAPGYLPPSPPRA